MPIQDTSQTTNKQHPVPQNIMDVEFKIIGELTMRQFFYMMIFGGLAYASFVGARESFLRWPLVFLFVSLGLALAFLPYEERGLDQWIINFFRAIYMPNQRIWKKLPEIFADIPTANMDMLKQEMITLAPTSSRRKLEQFLDQQGTTLTVDPLDIPETEYNKKIRVAFAPVMTATPVAAPPVEAPEVFAPPAPQTQPIPVEEPETENLPQEAQQSKQETKQQKDEKQERNEQTKVKEQPQAQAPKPLPQPRAQQPAQDHDLDLTPITPDQHSGRKFTSLLPEQGEIVLPIRGEKVLQTSEQQEIEEDIEEKAEQLKQLLSQIRGSEEGAEVLERAAEKVAEEEKVEQPQQQEESMERPEEVKAQVEESQKEATKKMESLQAKIFARKKAESPNKPEPQLIRSDRHIVGKGDIEEENVNSNIQPNIISGTIMDDRGKGLEGIVLIIKNAKGEPVRALKSDKIGKFSISTPLSNGNYSVEINKSNKTDLSFDIIKVEAKGFKIAPVKIAGRRGE